MAIPALKSADSLLQAYAGRADELQEILDEIDTRLKALKTLGEANTLKAQAASAKTEGDAWRAEAVKLLAMAKDDAAVVRGEAKAELEAARQQVAGQLVEVAQLKDQMRHKSAALDEATVKATKAGAEAEAALRSAEARERIARAMADKADAMIAGLKALIEGRTPLVVPPPEPVVVPSPAPVAPAPVAPVPLMAPVRAGVRAATAEEERTAERAERLAEARAERAAEDREAARGARKK